jgi:hypothetical protein
VKASRGRLGQHDAWPAAALVESLRSDQDEGVRAFQEKRSRSGRGGDARGRLARRRRGRGRRRWNKRRPPSFSARISKSRLFGSKLFQTIPWRFCGISRSYKGSKPNLMASKFLRTTGPVSVTFWTPLRPIASPRAVGVRRAFNGSRQKRRGRVHGGGAIRIERILKLARILILGNEMSLSFTADRGANPA